MSLKERRVQQPISPSTLPSEDAHVSGQTPPIGLDTHSRVLFVTSEMSDFLKAGGLGEVSAALPRAMNGICDVRVLMPGYGEVWAATCGMEVVRSMPGTAQLPPWSLGRVTAVDGLVIYIVLCDELYKREGSPYGTFDGQSFQDNDIRFARLSRAAAEIASGEADPTWVPDVVHVNDWPSALTAGYMRWMGLTTPSILTIHNLSYQGLFDPARLGALAIPESAFQVDGAEFHGQLSFLKAGIYYSSCLTTVSETYAREITTKDHGCGLHGILSQRMEEGRLAGITNGIDQSWVDLAEEIRASDSVSRWKQSKAAEVRRMFGLSASEGPLFSIVSRLVYQKGIDLSLTIADAIVAAGGQIVVTGRGEPEIERAVSAVARKHPGAIAANIGFNEKEARAMFAGSDFLLMPSRFEPCGLSQMYAQSAASLPIACKTGGLADTIEDGRSGFLFLKPDHRSFINALKRALGAFRSKSRFQRMRRTAISKKFDWAAPARSYAAVYGASLT